MNISKIVILVCIVILASCSGTQNKSESFIDQEISINDSEKAFLSSLAGLCGQSFLGKQIYSKDGRDSWAGKKLVMHVTVCEEDKVFIPFHVDENKSRTWMFLVEDGKLRFRHDHRHEDGTPEDLTLYGGFSDGKGSDLVQCFPWDEYTESILTDGNKRQWNVSLNEDLSTFTYELYVNEELVFAAEFDLTKPITAEL
ncbi:MAG: hypothetical protein KGZ97_10530 [Bacteroidetes bacterium]|nr:hypothetical protein [Bacteroidota bacterium]